MENRKMEMKHKKRLFIVRVATVVFNIALGIAIVLLLIEIVKLI